MLVVTGGEPLCHPERRRLFEGLHASRLHWSMVSNGYALDAAALRELAANGLCGLTISLDGPRELHDWLRGRPESYDRALAAIRLAAMSRVPNFDVVTCVHPRNLGHLDATLETLRAAGVRAWRLFSIFPKGRAQDNPDLGLSDDAFRSLFAWIAERRVALSGSGFSLEYSCEGYLPPAWDRRVRRQPYFCRAGINIASVLSDGSIAACPNIDRSLVQGNIRIDDFAEVWERRFQSFIDRDWMRTGDCERCSEWRRCRGNSLHLWDPVRGQTARCHHQALS